MFPLFLELTFPASSVCVVLGIAGFGLLLLWVFVRKHFEGPYIDWEMLNRQYEAGS